MKVLIIQKSNLPWNRYCIATRGFLKEMRYHGLKCRWRWYMWWKSVLHEELSDKNQYRRYSSTLIVMNVQLKQVRELVRVMHCGMPFWKYHYVSYYDANKKLLHHLLTWGCTDCTIPLIYWESAYQFIAGDGRRYLSLFKRHDSFDICTISNALSASYLETCRYIGTFEHRKRILHENARVSRIMISLYSVKKGKICVMILELHCVQRVSQIGYYDTIKLFRGANQLTSWCSVDWSTERKKWTLKAI